MKQESRSKELRIKIPNSSLHPGLTPYEVQREFLSLGHLVCESASG